MLWPTTRSLAVDLVEQDETNLLEQSKMTTLLGIVNKLPPQIVASRARLQLTIAWANLLLQRQGPMQAAVNRFQAGMTNADLDGDDTRGFESRSRRAASGRGNTRRPHRERGRSGRRSDVEAGHSTSAGARGGRKYRGVRGDLPIRLRHRPPTARLGLALQRDDGSVLRRLRPLLRRHRRQVSTRHPRRPDANFREAFEIASGVGPHSHAARLAGALLGQLLYETGDLAEATRLLEESYQFGSEGGGVDYLAARFVDRRPNKSTTRRSVCGDRAP